MDKFFGAWTRILGTVLIVLATMWGVKYFNAKRAAAGQAPLF